jgi:hypothetical protein
VTATGHARDLGTGTQASTVLPSSQGPAAASLRDRHSWLCLDADEVEPVKRRGLNDRLPRSSTTPSAARRRIAASRRAGSTSRSVLWMWSRGRPRLIPTTSITTRCSAQMSISSESWLDCSRMGRPVPFRAGPPAVGAARGALFGFVEAMRAWRWDPSALEAEHVASPDGRACLRPCA